METNKTVEANRRVWEILRLLHTDQIQATCISVSLSTSSEKFGLEHV